ACCVGDTELNVTSQCPGEPASALEAGQHTTVQYRASARIQHIDRLAANARVPIDGVDTHPMCKTIGQVEVRGKPRGVKPGGCQTIGRGGYFLQGARISS